MDTAIRGAPGAVDLSLQPLLVNAAGLRILSTIDWLAPDSF